MGLGVSSVLHSPVRPYGRTTFMQSVQAAGLDQILAVRTNM